MRSVRILVVDDDPQIRRVMKAALAKQGYIIGDAEVGKPRLRNCVTSATTWLSWTGICRRMGGVEACRSMREHSDIGIIMLNCSKD